MNDQARKQREKRGWRFGNADEFLGLSEQETAYIDLKLALAAELRKRRRREHLTQAGLASVVGSSQSRVARMEAADPSVSIDLLVRSLLALGATRRDIARTLR